MKPLASLSLDLDNEWSYLKTHGDVQWEALPSYLDVVVPRALDLLGSLDLTITFFVVGQDAALERNHDAIAALSRAATRSATTRSSTSPGCTATPRSRCATSSRAPRTRSRR